MTILCLDNICLTLSEISIFSCTAFTIFAEIGQISHEDTFKLWSIRSTVLLFTLVIEFALVNQNGWTNELNESSINNFLSDCNHCIVFLNDCKINESPQYYTLIVTPSDALIVNATLGLWWIQTVVDKPLGIKHPCMIEPTVGLHCPIIKTCFVGS